MARIINKYNPIERRYERVPEDWTLKRNVISGKFEYAPADAVHNYGVPQQQFTLRSPSNQPKWNPIEGRFEQAGDDWELEYNVITGEYVYVPKSGR